MNTVCYISEVSTRQKKIKMGPTGLFVSLSLSFYFLVHQIGMVNHMQIYRVVNMKV